MIENYFAMAGPELTEIIGYAKAMKEQARHEEIPQAKNHICENGLGIIPIEGPLFNRRKIMITYTGGAVYQEIAAAVTRYAFDDKVKEIVLLINSPGGEVAGCCECADVIYYCRNLKPVTALINGHASSGAYWLASAAHRVLLSSQTADVGSVGVKITMELPSEDKGIHCSGNLKAPLVRTASPERDEFIAQTLEETLNTFAGAISHYRGSLTQDQLVDLKSGRTFAGNSAIKAGLADGIFSPFLWVWEQKIAVVNY